MSKKFKTMFFSLLPGAGHLYLGLEKQGLQLMGIFFLTIYLADFTNIGLFGIFLPLIWFYSFFDAKNKASLDYKVDDKDILNLEYLKNEQNFLKNKSRFIGYGLIIIGLLSILQRIVFPLIHVHLSWELRNYIQTGFVSAIFILLGTKLILGRSVKCDNGN